MKGNEIYVVSDLDGKPLFSITKGCDIDFRPIIIRAADKIISLGINRPVLVFDRGGYGVHFFSELSTRADFVTWAKYVKKDELKKSGIYQLLDVQWEKISYCRENKTNS